VQSDQHSSSLRRKKKKILDSTQIGVSGRGKLFREKGLKNKFLSGFLFWVPLLERRAQEERKQGGKDGKVTREKIVVKKHRPDARLIA